MRAINGQFNSKRKRNFLFLVVLALLVWLLVGIFGQGADNNREYNAHMCAVYGYQPDCRTPLE